MKVPPSVLGGDLGTGLQHQFCRGLTVKGIAHLVTELTDHLEQAEARAVRHPESLAESDGALVVRSEAIAGRFGRWIDPGSDRSTPWGSLSFKVVGIASPAGSSAL
jgi:hypothetical protein